MRRPITPAHLPILSFTGTRKGLTLAQYETLREWLTLKRPSIVIHGGAVGADTMVEVLAQKARIATRIVRPTKRTTPLARNKIIVACGARLLACPRGMTEERRSGTWATVRLARKALRPITFIYPDGTVHDETPEA